ncbi:TetR/AcrR family transcriptional regulator [Paenibacillus sp. 1011MAR3C5]|uniref:TetR/AcrR family transcriptional regulator n=1 Tax=Paenibacillus sp. 1011MAR3C5 TaxID=1675787 RepID=UPI000E6C7C6B|nr:TetR/AcrR family transcriptional regulator [Paenibacillus sp. 1011MAR3C5]RJE85198.1 TetR/AcrR family transcriptional regulator [Paenibacillus sp. 1011MAR3C5]
MTANKIMEVALRHFARNGYDGASLADISAEVGIKKPSIYNHFNGKDDMFLTVFKDAGDRETLFIQDYLEKSSSHSLENKLYSFLSAYRNRYEQEDDTKFFLRIAFFPPAHLEKEVVDYSNLHLDRTNSVLETVFKAAADSGQLHPEVSIDRASTAFTAVLDGLFVEMIYGDLERFQKRLDASWFVFWRGIQNNT